MTENEAIKYLRMATDEVGNEEFSDVYKEMCKLAIRALEEIQQYRAIGTPEKILEKIGGLDVELGKYACIGTMEEFKALKEKEIPKKPKHSKKGGYNYFDCPTCGACVTIEMEHGCEPDYELDRCEGCGQAIDWS